MTQSELFPDEHEVLILRASTPAWGLPCHDAASLNVYLNLGFAKVPYKLEYTPYPYVPGAGPLPALEIGSRFITRHDIVSFVQKHAFNIDLSYEHSDIDILCYRVFFEERLSPLLDHVLYLDDHNFFATSSPLYVEALPFPVGTFLARRQRYRVRSKLDSTGFSNRERCLCAFVEVLDLVEQRLHNAAANQKETGTPSFLFGVSPTSADACLAAHLLIAWSAPVRCDNLRELIEERVNVRDYLAFITSVYLNHYAVSRDFESESNCSISSGGDSVEMMEDFYDRTASSSSIASDVHFFRFPPSWRSVPGDVSVPVTPAAATMTPEECIQEHQLKRNNRVSIALAISAVVVYIVFGNFVRNPA